MNSRFRRLLPRIVLWTGLSALVAGAVMVHSYQMRIKRLGDGRIQLDWDAQPSALYEVLWRSNLVQGPWLLMTETTAVSNSVAVIDAGEGSRPHPALDRRRFYYVRQMPSGREPTTVTNDIILPTTWSLAESPYLVTRDILIQNGASLSIEAGVEVFFQANSGISVSGSLRILGSAAQPVQLTSADFYPWPGDWIGVKFLDLSDDASCLISNAVIGFAKTGVRCVDASPAIVQSIIRDGSENGIYLERSSAVIRDNVIENNSQDGIYAKDRSFPQVTGNRIWGNGSDGIELSGDTTRDRNSLPILSRNVIYENSQYGLRTVNYFEPRTTVISARSNWWGSAEAALIAQTIYDNTDNPNNLPVVDYGNWWISSVGPALSGLFVQGQLASNQVWRAADSPVRVLTHFQVASNATLRIEPGVSVLFMGAFRFETYGALAAAGAADRPITFTSGFEGPWPGDWIGLQFKDSSDDATCLLSNVVVEYARIGIDCASASPSIVSSRIRHGTQQGIYLDHSSPLIQNCVIENNDNEGIYCVNRSSPDIFNNQIFGNQYGIRLSAQTTTNQNSLPRINGNLIYRSRSYALFTQSYYQPNETVINARNNWWGVANPPAIQQAIYDRVDSANSPYVDFGNYLLTSSGPPAAGFFVNGPVLTNTTWRAIDSPIYAAGDLIIPTNVTLRIEPGVRVEFMGSYGLAVNGALRVLGASNAPIVFTSGRQPPARGHWTGIQFNDTSDDAACVVSNAVLEYAVNGIRCSSASPSIVQSTIRLNSERGVFLQQSSPLIQSSLIESNSNDGIYGEWLSHPSILGNVIRNNDGDGIEVYGDSSQPRNSLPAIHFNQLLGNKQMAVRAGNYNLSQSVVINARSNWWGSVQAVQISAMIYDYNDNTTRSPVVDFGNWYLSETGPAVAGTPAQGILSSNAAWRISDSPIQVLGHLTVATNATLAIDPGVQVYFHGNYRIEVGGALQALGNPSNRVVFTSAQNMPAQGNWEGLRFLDASDDASCVLSNVLIEFAAKGVSCESASPAIVGAQFRNNQTAGYFHTSTSRVDRCLVELNQTGLDIYDNADPIVQSNMVTLQQRHGLSITASTRSSDRNPDPILLQNSLTGNGTSGANYYDLYAYNFYSAATVTIGAQSNWWATDASNLIERVVYHRVDHTYSPTVDFSNPLAINPNFTPFGIRHAAQWFSPNGDGRGDTLIIQGAISADSSWNLEIVDLAGAVVRRFAGAGTSVSNVWDGASQAGAPAADGVYRSRVVATHSGDGRVAAAHGEIIRLDRTAPFSSVALNSLPDGKYANELVFQGTASDDAFAFSVVDYGIGAAPTNFITIRSNTLPVINGTLGQIDSRTLSNGVYVFRVRTADLAGNLVQTQWVAQVDNVKISGAALSRQVFDPPLEAVSIDFTLSKRSDVTVDISMVETNIDFMGSVGVTFTSNTVWSARQTMDPGARRVTWDGRDPQGQLLEPGIYAFTVRAAAEHGRSDAYQPEYVPGPVTVSSVTVNTNFNFQANEPVEITFSLFAPAFVFLAVPNQAYPIIWGEAQDAGARTVYWNGRNSIDHSLYYGRFTLSTKTQILPENAVALYHRRGLIIADLQAEAYVIVPSHSTVSEIHYTLNRNANVQLRLRDPNGNYISLFSLTARPAGTHKLEWNGAYADDAVVRATGDYEMILLAIDPDTGIQETRVANLTVR